MFAHTEGLVFVLGEERYMICHTREEFKTFCYKSIRFSIRWLKRNVFDRVYRMPDGSVRRMGYFARKIVKGFDPSCNIRDTERRLRHSVLFWSSSLANYGCHPRVVAAWYDYYRTMVLPEMLYGVGGHFYEEAKKEFELLRAAITQARPATEPGTHPE